MFDKLKLNLKVGAALAAAGALLVTAGCGATADRAEPGAEGSANGGPLTGVRFMVPNTAGGGYDTTARAAAKVMDEIKATENVEVFNLAGAGGTVGLSRTVSEKGNGQLMMMMGLGVVGAQYTNKSEAKLDQTTPIAKLIEIPLVVVANPASGPKTIAEMIARAKQSPNGLSYGSTGVNSGQHLTMEMLKRATGANLVHVPYRGSAPAERFLVDGGPATVGIIASVTAPFCGACDRTRLTADGQVRNCLFSQRETDLRGPLRDGASDEELAALITGEMWRKAKGHGIGSADFVQPLRPMSAIGG